MTKMEKRIVLLLKIIFSLLILIPTCLSVLLLLEGLKVKRLRQCSNAYDCKCEGKICHCLYEDKDEKTREVKCKFNQGKE